MDPTTASLHRRSSSDRLLHPFIYSPNITTAADADDFNEAELFWSGDTAESDNNNRHAITTLPDEKNNHRNFDRGLNSGILAVLTEPDPAPVLRRKSSLSSSSSRMIPSLPRPPATGSDYLSQSVGSRKFQQSAPVKVPMMSIPRRRNVDELAIVDDDVDDDEEMLPPHEIVARGSGVSPKTTFSVLEGVGRTLKGRDLRQG